MLPVKYFDEICAGLYPDAHSPEETLIRKPLPFCNN